MKSKDFLKEISKLSHAELRARGKALKEELFKLRFRLTASQLEQTHRLNEVRRNYARVMTLMMQKSN